MQTRNTGELLQPEKGYLPKTLKLLDLMMKDLKTLPTLRSRARQALPFDTSIHGT